MKYFHHTLEFIVPEVWLRKGNVISFEPKRDSYLPYYSQAHGGNILFININDVAPLTERARIKGVFCDNDDDTAEQRILRLFGWYKDDKPIEPVKVKELKGNALFKYELREGCHRFHSSIVIGFTKIPAIICNDIFV